MTPEQIVRVKVRNIAVGGEGVGEVVSQSDGKSDLLGISAFVPFAGIGEEVTAKVLEIKKNYLRGKLLEVASSSESRITPECKYYTNCGGCELQHISYKGQLEAKLQLLTGALRSVRISSDYLDLVLPVVASEPFSYRRRISLHIDGRGKIGFYEAGTRSVVEIDSCSVATPALNEALVNIKEFATAVSGLISSVNLEEDKHGVIAVLKARYDLGDKERRDLITTTKNFFNNAVLLVGEKEVDGIGRQLLELSLNEQGTLTLRLPAGGFSQINWPVNLALIKRVVELALLQPGARVQDLYAGAGNFTLPLARAGAEVTAVENDKRLSLFCRENIKRQHLEKHVNFVENSVERFLKDKKSREGIDVVVADPPRSGLQKLCESLSYAKRLVLISCHLPSFVRDLKNLSEEGWTPTRIEPFDMFPQTSYLEILSVYER